MGIKESFDEALYQYVINLQKSLKNSAGDKLELKNKWFQNQIQWNKYKNSKGDTAFEVGIRDTVYFSELLTDGGTKVAKKKYIFVPHYRNLGLRTNQFVPRSKRPKALLGKTRGGNSKRTYIFESKSGMPYLGKVKGTGQNQTIKVLYFMHEEVDYKKGKQASYPFIPLAEKHLKKHDLVEFMIKLASK